MPQNKSPEEVEKLLDPQIRIEFKLQEELKRLGDRNVVLVIMDGANYLATSAAVYKYLAVRSAPGVVVSVNKPVNDLKNFLTEHAVPLDGWYFIDCITELQGIERPEPDHTVYLGSPRNLLETSVEVEKCLESMKKQNPFVIMDSISTFLLYNKSDVVERFVHNLTTKIHASNAMGIVLMIRLKENQDVVEIISQFCDSVIEITDKSIKSQ